MDRPIAYPGAGVADTDFLNSAKDAYVGLARLAYAVLGVGPGLVGFPCSPGVGLTVSIGIGDIYAVGSTDYTPYGSLPADSHVIIKQGLLFAPVVLNCPAPTTAGQSIAYLVQVQQQDVDGTPIVLPFYDSSNPAVPYSGPANAGTPLNTVRSCIAAVQIKAGASATTGTQVTPASDAGWTGAWVVTVAYGQVFIAAGNISQVTANFVAPLPAKASLQAPAFTQDGFGNYPTGPTPSAGDSSTNLATTAFVDTGYVRKSAVAGAYNHVAITPYNDSANVPLPSGVATTVMTQNFTGNGGFVQISGTIGLGNTGATMSAVMNVYVVQGGTTTLVNADPFQVLPGSSQTPISGSITGITGAAQVVVKISPAAAGASKTTAGELLTEFF